MTQDIRWKQRFNNYTKALNELSADVALRESRKLSRLEEKGLIQSFEMVHELAWNVLKDYLEDVAGTTGLFGSKDSTREAFKRGLIEDGEAWMEMIKSRNLTSHVYDESTARDIAEDIAARFHPSFLRMHQHFLSLYERS
ncbi:MAG: nucleotidyltransferase [Hydrogenophilales bacterium CG_4_9_14_3_um_filter_59_35]|nr:MAG: nucleotidyltransferase [Hydrogenophilales bacterium CG18_big_fil_WC_8_21_14_2_50_58_12]PIY01249.1 MAG: nucleotidyltransferase [Hydrogenophilales bacterium CG_4_10_14_3_um_filter_58_23]PJB04466.1 MAG: nucleotidyltransferase [Hydrogenophilales bacterium CG_4_9_14_3_um_filter_59_35]